MSSVKLVSISKPVIEECSTAEELVAFCARVSNPNNQANHDTSAKLLKYLVNNSHWSPFEMVSLTLEINTTRDIGRQILRHRSFSFQEFSQRYASVDLLGDELFEFREARIQDPKNRQKSIETDDEHIKSVFRASQERVKAVAQYEYEKALACGVAKEQARCFLPEGMTKTRMYMAGTLRSWIHYCDLRMGNGTQKEHQEVAIKAWDIVKNEVVSLTELLS